MVDYCTAGWTMNEWTGLDHERWLFTSSADRNDGQLLLSGVTMYEWTPSSHLVYYLYSVIPSDQNVHCHLTIYLFSIYYRRWGVIRVHFSATVPPKLFWKLMISRFRITRVAIFLPTRFFCIPSYVGVPMVFSLILDFVRKESENNKIS